ncbi:hypothetical protein YPPY46_1616 [Yersinia pestis PY-46]|uniref:Uncharacterized protein n=1 Tax=Yersinia pestis biovar Orientalis str. IP275 TaxID=373665 RepID=A0AAV3B417_YERPE|nr:hypothetical protein YPC_2819 [Yersinia pestis biovar Medievalis str. Harbin 35]EDR31682.1 hypothetical protein YPIP275_3826 [Yersinia pestis biovar Orientalis str. IP275]EDR40827.1 hypothetical protein YpF1991016_0306 [Yersinia pestis biovar Orientalis str. F1991016]EDR43451.1 hypothetical protein YpE1979001_2628 [Yersinia pestis biovar Antiqua str. E1979001]EDR51678.1 hypothetical protein YpB42003004_2395 [Yersinia pestis biovar Antiqua str. B42003004]EDR58576.1 hypothetical protein YpMG0
MPGDEKTTDKQYRNGGKPPALTSTELHQINYLPSFLFPWQLSG